MLGCALPRADDVHVPTKVCRAHPKIMRGPTKAGRAALFVCSVTPPSANKINQDRRDERCCFPVARCIGPSKMLPSPVKGAKKIMQGGRRATLFVCCVTSDNGGEHQIF
jgi:hypothetical protein